MEYKCPLIKKIIDETVCYDIQMITGNMINKRVLKDYDFFIDENLVTKEKAKNHCETCPFNQLKQAEDIKIINKNKINIARLNG